MSPDELRADVARQVSPCEALRRAQAVCYGGVEVAAGDVPEAVRAPEHGEAERQRYAEEPDSEGTESPAENTAAAAAAEDENERTDELRDELSHGPRCNRLRDAASTLSPSRLLDGPPLIWIVRAAFAFR